MRLRSEGFDGLGRRTGGFVGQLGENQRWRVEDGGAGINEV